MRNVQIYTPIGQALDLGTARLVPSSVTVTQFDQITPQFMDRYGQFVAIADMDGVVEFLGDEVNPAYLVNYLGWTVPGFRGEPPAKPGAKDLPEPADDDLPLKSETDESLESEGGEEGEPGLKVYATPKTVVHSREKAAAPPEAPETAEEVPESPQDASEGETGPEAPEEAPEELQSDPDASEDAPRKGGRRKRKGK